MTTDITGLSGDPAPTAADAAVLQLAEAADSAKAKVTPFGGAPETSPSFRAEIRTILESAVRALAATKNVQLTPEELAHFAATIEHSMDDAAATSLREAAPDATRFAAMSINIALDLWAARRTIRAIWTMKGFVELDEACITARALEWISHSVAAGLIDLRYRWPNPLDLVADYMKIFGTGPVTIQLPPDAKRRSAYLLDPVRCRMSGKNTYATISEGKRAGQVARPPAAVPLLIQCPGVPGTSIPRPPDGCHVERHLDGTVIARWIKDNKLHRDPKQGAALERTGPQGEHKEYRVNGRLHRDPADGPALIDPRFEGRDVRSEEYYWDGEFHRPTSEGPAVHQTDAQGRCVRQLYAEHGLRHRDPSEGPAWWGIEDGVEKAEYWVNGQRLESDTAAETADA